MFIARRHVGAALALGCFTASGTASGTPSGDADARARFPNVLLADQDGRSVHFYDDLVRGEHTVVINFIYARCAGICPAATANLAKVQELLGERLGRGIRMASLSLDAERDTPAVLKAYAAGFGVRPGWQFLTGKVGDIDQVRRRLGVFERDQRRDRDRSQHTGMIVYGTQARDRWGRVSAFAPPDRIYQSITRWS